MSRVIWKFEIRPNAIQGEVPHDLGVLAPEGARPISVGMQGKQPCVWVEVDTSKPRTNLGLCSVGTGFGNVPDGHLFIGTIIEEPYVWHVYWRA